MLVVPPRQLPRRRDSVELIASGAVARDRLYAAAVVLARLQDRGVARDFMIEEMCEVLGYLRAPGLVAVAG